MKKKIFYWSPCLNPVGTIKSTLNSAMSLKRYNKNYDVYMINVCGEWKNYEDTLKKNSINFINLNFSYYRFLPKTGFFLSRFSYMIIFLLSFFPLLNLIRSQKPNIFFLHLITSLPLTILKFFNFKTEFILRISGYPKMTIFRKILWKSISSKIKLVTCPTFDLKKELDRSGIFGKEKLFFLPDAIIDITKVRNKNEFIDNELPKNKKIILSAGRLTKQKNYEFLINEFAEFSKTNDQYILVILGEGEEKNDLLKLVENKGIEKKVFFLGYKKNIYDYMRAGNVFILSSLWEEVGFVIVEAALCNSFVVSSNCPNGPREFLDNGKRGILFESNKESALNESLKNFSKMEKNIIFQKKVKLKKEAKKYTIFRHYLELEKILKN